MVENTDAEFEAVADKNLAEVEVAVDKNVVVERKYAVEKVADYEKRVDDELSCSVAEECEFLNSGAHFLRSCFVTALAAPEVCHWVLQRG